MTFPADSVTAAAASTASPRELVYRPKHELDLHRTVGFLRRGRTDPTTVIDGSVIWRAVRTPVGPATLALRSTSGEVRASAWGDGAEHALEAVPVLCGRDDDATDFDAAHHPLIAESARRHPGLRLTRSDEVFDALVCAIIEQKVTGMQAFGAWRWLVSRFGERAPGPTPRPMFAAPPAEQWHRIPSWDFHRAGVEPPQARTIARAAERGDRIAKAVRMAGSGADRERILSSLPGVGAWTSAETRIRALGDPDGVSVGDYHLAHEVGFALTGKRTDDSGMLELLAPWAGQRQRVIRLMFASGVREPRRGPRLAPEDHRER